MRTSCSGASCGGALRRTGLPPLRFHDLRQMAGSLMHKAGISLKRAQEILGHAREHTTLAIYTYTMRRTRDDSADKIAELAGLAPPGNNREATASVEGEGNELSLCFTGSPGWNRTNDQRINSPTLYR
jgi:Phage integrase family